MDYKVKVKPADGTSVGWVIQTFESNPPPVGDQHFRPVIFTNNNNGTFSATVTLSDREHGLACSLALAGREIEIDMDPRPKIFQPFDGTWPFTAAVPDNMTQDLVKIFFNTGQRQ